MPLSEKTYFWLVVKQPLWKIWVSQLGWWHSQDMESHKSHVPNHQPDFNEYLHGIRHITCCHVGPDHPWWGRWGPYNAGQQWCILHTMPWRRCVWYIYIYHSNFLGMETQGVYCTIVYHHYDTIWYNIIWYDMIWICMCICVYVFVYIYIPMDPNTVWEGT